jgi:hypothetical protein
MAVKSSDMSALYSTRVGKAQFRTKSTKLTKLKKPTKINKFR